MLGHAAGQTKGITLHLVSAAGLHSSLCQPGTVTRPVASCTAVTWHSQHCVLKCWVHSGHAKAVSFVSTLLTPSSEKRLSLGTAIWCEKYPCHMAVPTGAAHCACYWQYVWTLAGYVIIWRAKPSQLRTQTLRSKACQLLLQRRPEHWHLASHAKKAPKEVLLCSCQLLGSPFPAHSLPRKAWHTLLHLLHVFAPA